MTQRYSVAGILAEAGRLGFSARLTAQGHWCLSRENPRARVIVGRNMEDWRAFRNALRDLNYATDPNHPFGKPVPRPGRP